MVDEGDWAKAMPAGPTLHNDMCVDGILGSS